MTDVELLTVKNVKMNDMGLYICWTGNIHGLNNRSAYITVLPGGLTFELEC